MGLDTVELLIELEEAYGISIPDEDAEGLGVLGDLARYIVARLEGLGRDADFEVVLRHIIDILVENYGVPEGKANSQSHVVLDLGLE